jgi:glycosyltransferase involved in cell wall biosynthesis
MRLAWFSPLPPDRSGIAAYSAELLAQLADVFEIDIYPERTAHDFLWRARRNPYDLVVYHLGNAACHDYMWAYLARYPGLVVLHDARLHHARARCLLGRDRIAEYRDEFRYDHPAVDPAVTQYAIEGLGGPVYYLWPMIKVVMDTARVVAVHSPWVAADLRDAFPRTRVEHVRMGVPSLPARSNARAVIRRQLGIPDESIVFAAFGKVTAEKRISSILGALSSLLREGRQADVMLVGDSEGYTALDHEIEEHGLREVVRVTGHVDDTAIADYLAAADACLCLRWPTALETSASWLRCLAAGCPTVITDLAHLADVPTVAAARVDVLTERSSLLDTMRRLIADPVWRRDLGQAGHEYWRANHTLEIMAADYSRLIPEAASRPAPGRADLPGHFLEDYSTPAKETIRHFGVQVDVLEDSQT